MELRCGGAGLGIITGAKTHIRGGAARFNNADPRHHVLATESIQRPCSPSPKQRTGTCGQLRHMISLGLGDTATFRLWSRC